MLRPGDRLGVAVSGGADSVCLLRVLRDLAQGLNVHVSVLHLDHGLRGEESRNDCEFVRALAAELDLPFITKRIDVAAAAAASKLSIEEAGRNARASFYRDFLSAGGNKVATGHTKSDQAETVLFRLLRGTGLTGLSGIAPITNEGLIRPMLALERNEIRLWLEKQGFSWREDKSNLSSEFDRNRIRLDLMPQLAREWNPQIESSLSRLADIAREEDKWWNDISEQDLAKSGTSLGKAWVLSVDEVAQLGVARHRRLLRRVFSLLLTELKGIDLQHVEAARELFQPGRGDGRLQIPGLDLMRSLDWVRICRLEDAGAGKRFVEVHITPPCRAETQAPDLELLIESVSSATPRVTRLQTAESQYNEGSQFLDAKKLKDPLVLRCWRPGDRIRIQNQSEPIKVKTLFQDARVPIWERSTWPVLECGGDVIWARRFGVSAEYAATDDSRQVLQVTELDLRNHAVDGIPGNDSSVNQNTRPKRLNNKNLSTASGGSGSGSKDEF